MKQESPATKFFTLYRYKLIPVKRFAADYGEEDLKRFREMFRPIAENYRRRVGIGMIIVAVGFASILICSALSQFYIIWCCLASGVVCFLAGSVLMFYAPPLKCPACGNVQDTRLGLFCPECGNKAVQKGGWLKVTRCTSCGKRLSGGKGRPYKIRACTHCGVKLDDRGL